MLKSFYIFVAFLLPLFTQAQVELIESFDVFNAEGERIVYQQEQRLISVYDPQGELEVEAQAEVSFETLMDQGFPVYKRSLKFSNGEVSYEMTLRSLGELDKNGRLGFEALLSSTWSKKTPKKGFFSRAQESNVVIPVVEFSKTAKFEESFSISGQDFAVIQYDASQGKLFFSSQDRGLGFVATQVQYMRSYRVASLETHHHFNFIYKGRSFSLSLISQSSDRNFGEERLIHAVLEEKSQGMRSQNIKRRWDMTPSKYEVKSSDFFSKFKPKSCGGLL